MRELGTGLFPDGGSGFLVEQLLDAEVALQLQVRPVVERIAQGVRDGACPGEEFVIGICVARDVALGFAIAAEGAPLVVISSEPDFEQVGELAVLGDVLRREVIVVIEDRFAAGEVVVELSGRGCGEEEIVVNECHGREGGWVCFDRMDRNRRMNRFFAS